MTPYIILILAADVLVLVGMTIHGIHAGFAKLISKVISLVVSIAVVVLLSSIVSGYRKGDTSNFLIGVVFLIILGALYKLIHAILSSIRFLAGLPILTGVDKILGAVTGFLGGFGILYIAEYLLRVYLLR